MPPVDYYVLDNVYVLWDYNCDGRCAAIAANDDIACEMATFVYGSKATCNILYSNAIEEILEEVRVLKENNIKQGYIINGIITIYKTRTEIINEVLDGLN